MSWRVVALGDVADTALGKMLEKGKDSGRPRVEYLRNINVQWGRIDTEDLLTMELPDEERERFEVRAGDLLVCEGGEIGRAAIWNGRSEYIAFQKALHRVRPREALDTRFLRYILEYHAQNGVLARLATGSTIAHLPQQQLRKVPVPLPPLDEQRRIVELLEDHLSRLDAAESSLKLAMRRTDAMATASLDRQTTAERTGWPDTTIGAMAELVEYGSSAKCAAQAAESDVPVLRMGNIQNGVIDWNALKFLPSGHQEFPKLLLQSGDLIFNRTNSAELVGKSAVFEGTRVASFASYLIRVRFGSDVNPKWANMVINSPAGRRYVKSVASQQVGQANVNGTKLKAFPLPLPPIDEQCHRVRAHEEILASRERLRGQIADSILRAVGLRRSILAAAFSGRLTNSSDEVLEELESV